MAGFKIEYTSCCCWEKRVLFCSRRENASVSALIVVVHVVHYYCIDYHYQTRDVEMMKGCIRKVYFEPPKLSSNLLDSIHFRNHYAFVTLRYQNSKYEYTKKTLKIWFMRSFLSNLRACAEVYFIYLTNDTEKFLKNSIFIIYSFALNYETNCFIVNMRNKTVSTQSRT